MTKPVFLELVRGAEGVYMAILPDQGLGGEAGLII